MNLGRGVNGVLLVVVVALASAVIPAAAPSAQTTGAAAALVAPSSQLFGFTDATQSFTVPAGVHQVHLTAWGGSGGSGGERSGLYAAPGGLGALINLDAPVNPGGSLVIQVGGQGGNASGELDVLRLLADGRTNTQIGAELYMSPKTASVHVSHILAKLRVKTRIEAAAAAHRLGLAKTGPDTS